MNNSPAGKTTKRLAHLSILAGSFAFAFATLGATGCGSSDEATAPVAAGSDSPAAPGNDSTAAPPPDGTAATPAPAPAPVAPAAPAGPHVLVSSPAGGAKGITSDVAITVKFDRAMDMESVIAAYASQALPASAVTFDWGVPLDELTITPKALLLYATGKSALNTYAITIAKTAKSKDGLALGEDFSLSFTTYRRTTSHVPRVANLSGRVLSDGSANASALVGDIWNGVAERQSKTFLTFDLTGIPVTSVFETATLEIDESNVAGTPDASLGAFTTHQVFFSALDAAAFVALPESGLATKRVFSLNGGATRRAANATAMIQDDLANRVVRGNRAQVRFQFATAGDGDSSSDFVALDVSSADLAIQYLQP